MPRVIIPRLIQLWETQHDSKVRCLRSDRGGEFTTMVLQNYAANRGIKIELSNPKQSNENGLAERFNRLTLQTMSAMLHFAQLPQGFWSYAARYSSWIWNSLPRKHQTSSPFEKFYNKIPPYKQFYTFGARGFMKNFKGNKLAGSTPIVYLGIDSNSISNIVYVPSTKKVVVARDIALDELALISKAKHKLRYQTTVKTRVPSTSNGKVYTSPISQEHVELSLAHDTGIDASASSNSTSYNDTVLEPTILDYNQPNLGEIDTSNIIPRERRTRANLTLVYLAKLSITATTLPPRSYFHIKGREDAHFWYDAYNKEIHNLEVTGGMTVVNTPANVEIIKILELFVVKRDNISNNWKAKVRIVARGDLQQSFGDFYAPVASVVAFRLFITLSTLFPTTIRQLDVTSAFLYGRLSNPIYITLPQGHVHKGGSSKVWRSMSAIYGLVQSPKIWNETIHSFLSSYGFRALTSETCLYTKNSQQHIAHAELILLLYVDDVLYTGLSAAIQDFESTITKKFNIKTKQ